MVAFDLWDHLGRRVSPMLAVYATAIVVLTVAAGTRCAWYGLTGPLDAEQSPPGPGIRYWILYLKLRKDTSPYPYQNQPEAWSVTPPPSGDGPGYALPCLSVIEPPPWFALRRGVKRYPKPHARARVHTQDPVARKSGSHIFHLHLPSFPLSARTCLFLFCGNRNGT